MNGFDEKTLIELCDEKYVHNGYSTWKYWPAEIYSFGKHIRRYGFYLPVLPLNIYTDHGAGKITTEPALHEIESEAYCQFYHSPLIKENWRNFSSKPGYVLYSPFVFYRKTHKTEKAPDAKGTLAFFAHSTPAIENASNVEEYIEQLKNLPEEFQPVSISLHMHDINNETYKIFIKHGVPVYTSGHVCDYRFAERFYNILRNFKYTTSPIIGSYTYYSVEMGIPFSIYGNQPKFINKSDPNVKAGEYNYYDEYAEYRIIYDMFHDLQKEITPEQKELVERDLGLKEGISRFKMAKILYISYLKQGNLVKDLLYPFIKYSKRPRLLFKQIGYELKEIFSLVRRGREK